MLRILLVVLTLFPLSLSAAPTLDGALCELGVFQADSSRGGKPVLLFRDTVELVKGIRATGFLASFSIEIEIASIDTG